MLDMLTMFINNGVSVCAGGSTGSGKTTSLSYLLTTIDENRRLLSMEEGSREFLLKKKDEKGNTINSVVSLFTRESDNDKLRVSLQKLVELSMRMNPEIVAVGEMRSAEAYEVSEVARTGHTVVSTIHSMSAPATYRKMMTLAYKKYQMPTDFMMTLMVEAFPIIFFQKQLEDGSRKIVEIIEGTGYNTDTDEVEYRTLYKYVVLDKVKDANGNVTEVIGKHIKVNNISKELQHKLLDAGVTRQELKAFLDIPCEEEPEVEVD
jgi:pilus assembly protein CpaF